MPISIASHMLHHSQEHAFGLVPQKVHFVVGSRGWAGEPAHRRVIENGARSQLNDTSGTAGIIMSRL